MYLLTATEFQVRSLNIQGCWEATNCGLLNLPSGPHLRYVSSHSLSHQKDSIFDVEKNLYSLIWTLARFSACFIFAPLHSLVIQLTVVSVNSVFIFMSVIWISTTMSFYNVISLTLRTWLNQFPLEKKNKLFVCANFKPIILWSDEPYVERDL
jgi:hypothetical protein